MVSTFNKTAVKIIKLMPKPLVRLFSNRYIAGDYLSDAVRITKELNSKGILATIDVLGESISSKEEAISSKKACLEVLDAIRDNNLNANLSIKPTQMGLLLDLDFCYNNVLELVKKAAEFNNFVRIDMEDSGCTDLTITLYKRIKETHPNVGVVIQSYLKRSLKDVIELNKLKTNYRLCKGIYIEPEEIAYKTKQAVRDSFVEILDQMFKDGVYPGIATHDDYLVDEAKKLIKKHNLPKEAYEFQMLLGVKESLRDKLNSEGHKVRIYVPFGTDWYKYSMRRLQENPNMVTSIIKDMLKIG